MRTLCPNFDREYGLDTVLEVPIPEEMFPPTNNKWTHFKSWLKLNPLRSPITFSSSLGNSQIQLLLGVIAAPLIPLPIPSDPKHSKSVVEHPIDSSMAKYIIHQYIAAAGGDHALNSIDSMYAIGKVKMVASEFTVGMEFSGNKQKGKKHGGEVGGFVLWSKKPDLWCLELVVSCFKINAGSDGKVAWRQTPWHSSHASRGPPRPLRRSLQGLDPRLIANLFTNSIFIGERTVNGEDCFALNLQADPTTLEARSSSNIEIIQHTVEGYFSQRSGLLVHLIDSYLLKIKHSKNDSIVWETTMESTIQDYRPIDGINIAHSGKTSVSLFRFGETTDKHSRTRLEEVWSIEEVDFNIKGLTMDCFLPPSDINKEDDSSFPATVPKRIKSATKARNKLSKTKVVAVDDYL
ncbi:uncharacterized protein LOC141605323 [Silene latifolia]|uniref:uncharacterized protein LOC141605323 n=1 Tax=Silene latifolia TaxID=37657 RepID=UPI003D77E063